MGVKRFSHTRKQRPHNVVLYELRRNLIAYESTYFQDELTKLRQKKMAFMTRTIEEESTTTDDDNQNTHFCFMEKGDDEVNFFRSFL